MAISNILNIGRHAMGAQRGAMELASHNAANVATEGFSRRRGTLSSLGLGAGRGVLAGVKMGQPRRVIDALSNRSVRGARAEVSFHNGRRAALETIEGIVAPDGVGLGEAMDGFFSAFSRLTSNPAGGAERATVLHQAQVFVQELHNTHDQLEGLRRPLAQTANDTIGTINSLSAQIARLNEAQAVSEAGGGAEASELRDERGAMLDQLASLTGARVVEHQDGTVSVTLAGGGALVSAEGASRLAVRKEGDALQLSLEGPGGGPSVDLRPTDAGGELSGIVTAHNEDVGEAIAALDNLAAGFAQAVNALHSEGVGLDGQGGRAFFEGVDQVGGAARNISVTSAIEDDPDTIAATRDANSLPGGSELALELASLRERPLDALGGKTVESALTGLLVSTGHKVDATYDSIDAAEARGAVFEGIRESTRGVSLDEEMADLMKFQRGFEAASRVVRAADELMQTVLSLV